MKEMEYKAIAGKLEQKEEREDGSLHIKFYALAFGNVDSYDDVITATACDDFLKSENKDRMKLCYQHDRHEVIGVITDVKVDAIGMLVEADVLPTSTGKDAQLLLKAGAINEFSIGYWADRYHYERREGYEYEVRVLDAITVIEVSPVTRAANPKAILLDAKSAEFGNQLKAMSDAQLADLKARVAEEEARRMFSYMK